ncbi:MAG: dUTP diphosphatase [Armatimonadetes bacterium]|nr:dUTP diphosphatase [Armatimonadota bacterium]
MPTLLRVVLEPGAAAPDYASDGAAGLDVRSYEDVTLAPMERRLVRTGVRVEVPSGFEVQVRPRSGLAIKHGLALVNSPGTVDSDYRGEIGVVMINLGSDVVQLSRGERVAQLVVAPVERVEVVETDALSETTRGEGGFGSTGRA